MIRGEGGGSEGGDRSTGGVVGIHCGRNVDKNDESANLVHIQPSSSNVIATLTKASMAVTKDSNSI
jgi:hypothetical protein